MIDGEKITYQNESWGLDTCTKEDFNKNSNDKNLFEYYSEKKNQSLLCLNQKRQDEIKVQGILDFVHQEANHSYL